MLDSVFLRCGGEVALQQGPGFERGEVPVLGVPAEPGAVVLDLDEAEDVGPGRCPAVPHAGADLRLEQAEEAFGRGVIVTGPGPAHGLPHPQLLYLLSEFVRRVLASAVGVHDAVGLQYAT